MKEFLLGLIDQSSEQAARRDMGDYDPVSGTLKRSGMESFGDFFRGGPDSVNKAARELQVKSLQPTVREIQAIPGATTPVVDYTTTQADLSRKLKDAQREDARTQRTINFETNPAEQARITREDKALKYQKSRDAVKDKEASDLLRATIDKQLSDNTFRTAQLDVTRQQEANRMAEETRRYNERRADSKRERMAAIIAGLSNLGGAFAI